MYERIVFDSENISIWLDPERGIVHHRMHQPCYGEVLRTALTAGTDAMREAGASKWLSDDRANGAISPEDEDWSKNVWFPRAKAAGWTHWAVVMPEQVVGQMNLRRFVEAYAARGIEVRVFSDPGEAETWLLGLGRQQTG